MTIHDPPTSDTSAQSDTPSVEPSAIASERSLCEFERIELLQDSGELRATFDTRATRPTTAVISALAVALDTDPLDIDPLFYAIATDALDALLDPDGWGNDVTVVEFSYDQYDVEVCSSGSLTLRPESA